MPPIRTIVKLERDKHRLFLPFHTLIVLNACLAKAMLPPERWDKGDFFWYESCVFEDTELRLPLVGPIEYTLANRMPQGISITIGARSEPRGPRPGAANVARVVYNLIAPTFTEFYENNIEWVKRGAGNDASAWIEPWSFARIIRNCFAHGGRINITNPNAMSVFWQGLSYGPLQNGRRVLGLDLSPADILLLMIEMGEALHRIGCPPPEEF
jgi:hypothetical protein